MFNKPVLKQITLFGIIGVLATITHYFSALLFIKHTTLNLYLANLAGYLLAISVSFFGHGLFTFKVELSFYILKKFIIVSISAFICSELILFLLEKGLHFPHYISLGIVVLIIPLISFLLNKLWVYKAT